VNGVQYHFNVAGVLFVIFGVDQDIVNKYNTVVVIDVLPHKVNYQSHKLTGCIRDTKSHN
jgi:hypothetical protein